MLDLVVDLHTAPSAAAQHALADDFGIPHRDELELSFHPDDNAVWDGGPYAVRTSTLIIDNAPRIRRLLARYDDLVKETRGLSRPTVLTHGDWWVGSVTRGYLAMVTDPVGP